MVPLSSDPETENRHLREQLSVTQNALQDFVYAVSHDLGVPLRAVTSFSAILQQKYADQLDEKSRTYLNFIAEGGARAQKMLAGLLQYSRLHTQAEPSLSVDMNAALRSACNELKDKIEASGANLHCKLLPTVWADDHQMRQLLLAVLDNALTYRRSDVAPEIHIMSEDTEAAWRISVTDNGIGIPPESSERVFQIFKRLQPDEIFPGVGMGLSIARRIVERHGGVINILPALPAGTTCRFTLPKPALDTMSSFLSKEAAYE